MISNVISMVHWFIGKLYTKNQGPYSKAEKIISLLSTIRDRQTLLLMKLMYATKRDLLRFITIRKISNNKKLYAKIKVIIT